MRGIVRRMDRCRRGQRGHRWDPARAIVSVQVFFRPTHFSIADKDPLYRVNHGDNSTIKKQGNRSIFGAAAYCFNVSNGLFIYSGKSYYEGLSGFLTSHIA